MSESPDTCIRMEELTPLPIVPGTSDAENGTCKEVSRRRKKFGSCCDDKHYRGLAIWSIICGLSCIGIKALINSVEAEKTTDREESKKLSKKARKFGIISIVTWISILLSIPLLMGLISYLITFQD